MNQSNCPNCGSPLLYKKGVKDKINAQGQPYKKAWQGYFCQNRECGFVDWLQDAVQQPLAKPQYQTQPSGADKIIADIKILREAFNAMYSLEQDIYKLLIKLDGNQTSQPPQPPQSPREGNPVTKNGERDNTESQ